MNGHVTGQWYKEKAEEINSARIESERIEGELISVLPFEKRMFYDGIYHNNRGTKIKSKSNGKLGFWNYNNEV